MRKKLSKTEIEDLVLGTTVLGVGGGGSPDSGLKSLLEQFDRGRSLVIASLDEFDGEAVLASPYFVGSVAPSAPKKPMPTLIRDPIDVAMRLVEGKLGRRVAGTVASEIGGGNTAASLAIAAKLGIPMIDGDLMGRAGPELHQSTVHIFGYSMAPAAVVSETGNQLLVESYASIDDYEAMARYASVVSGGHVAVVDTPLAVSKAKKCLVLGTISRSIEIGSARREAVEEKNKDPVDAVAEKLENGRRIFEGVVSDYTWKDERGFLFGEAHVKGTKRWEGSTLKSWIMNEHIMCWIDEKPAVMAPDLIIFLDPESVMPITNDKLTKGTRVAVLGSSIDDVWRTQKGLSLFGPRHFGFDYDYVPFEKL